MTKFLSTASPFNQFIYRRERYELHLALVLSLNEQNHLYIVREWFNRGFTEIYSLCWNFYSQC